MNAPDNPGNQRSSQRLPAPSTVWLRCRRAAADQTTELANGLLDLSEGGLQFLSRQALAIDDTVVVTLGGSGTCASIRRQGDVRWVVELGGGACCAGVRFDEPLSADDVIALFPAAADEAATDGFMFGDLDDSWAAPDTPQV
jgi:hypothetical protein